MLTIRDNEGCRGRALVVVEHHLLNAGAEGHECLFDTFGAVLLAIAADEQTLEAPLHVEQTFGGHVA